MNSNSPSASAAGGGGNSSRTLNWIGINLTPGTREVANGTMANNQYVTGCCERAVQFYDFLKQQNANFFVDVPTVTMEKIGLIKKIVGALLPFSLNGNTTIDPDNIVRLSNTLCFDNKSQMQTDYLINNDIPGYLTMIGVTKNDAGRDVVWYVLTLYFGQNENKNSDVSVTIDGFCKNNDLMINGSRIGVDGLLRLCDEFNNTGNFKIKYCILDALKDAVGWWKLFGFKEVNKGGYGGSIMTRNFPDTSVSSNIVSAQPISLSSEPSTQEENQKDKLEDEIFERLQTEAMPEDLSNINSGPGSDDEYDTDDDTYDDTDNKVGSSASSYAKTNSNNNEGYTITGKKYKPAEEYYFKDVKPRLRLGGSKSKTTKKKTTKKKTNKKKTKRKVKRSRRRTRRF